MTQRRIDVNPLNAIVGIVLMILVFWGMYFAAKALFTLLSFLTPVMLIGAAILDYTVITDYAKWIFKTLRENPIMGIIGILLTFFGFPVVSGFLLGKAYLRNKLKGVARRSRNREEEEFVEYEEVDEPFEKLDLPKSSPRRPEPVRNRTRTNNNDYEQLFDNE